MEGSSAKSFDRGVDADAAGLGFSSTFSGTAAVGVVSGMTSGVTGVFSTAAGAGSVAGATTGSVGALILRVVVDGGSGLTGGYFETRCAFSNYSCWFIWI